MEGNRTPLQQRGATLKTVSRSMLPLTPWGESTAATKPSLHLTRKQRKRSTLRTHHFARNRFLYTDLKSKKRVGRLLSDSSNPLSGKRDSNPRPSAWEADALPTELLPQKNFVPISSVEIKGVEPLTSCMPCRRSSQLSYTPPVTRRKVTPFRSIYKPRDKKLL